MRSKNISKYMLFVMMIAAFSFRSFSASAQDCGPINTTQLRDLLVGLGFETKNSNEGGKIEKWEIKNVAAGLNIPTAFEISPSGNYIWITINLGKADTTADNTIYLKKNNDIQPAFFYITPRGNLQMALAVENRAVTPAVLKRCNNFITTRVGDTKEMWQKTD